MPIQPDPGLWNPAVTDEELHVLHHWGQQACRVQDELARWEKFRKYQQWKRQTTQSFDEYKASLDKDQKKTGVHWMLTLDQEIEKQTKLDEWKEYYLYEHRKLRFLERKLERVQQLPEQLQLVNGALRRAQHDLEVHNGLWQWVKEQLPIIEAQCAATAQDEESRRIGQKKAKRRRITRSPSKMTDNASQALTPIQTNPRRSMHLASRSPLDPVHPSRIYKPMVRKSELAPRSSDYLVNHVVLRRRRSQHETEMTSSLPQPNCARKRTNKGVAEVSGRWPILGPIRPSRVCKKTTLKSDPARVQQSHKASRSLHIPRKQRASASARAGEQLLTLRRSARILERVHEAQQSSNEIMGF